MEVKLTSDTTFHTIKCKVEHDKWHPVLLPEILSLKYAFRYLVQR